MKQTDKCFVNTIKYFSEKPFIECFIPFNRLFTIHGSRKSKHLLLISDWQVLDLKFCYSSWADNSNVKKPAHQHHQLIKYQSTKVWLTTKDKSTILRCCGGTINWTNPSTSDEKFLHTTSVRLHSPFPRTFRQSCNTSPTAGVLSCFRTFTCNQKSHALCFLLEWIMINFYFL